MGRSPCCETDANVKKGPWTQEEDMKLVEYIEEHGPGNWRNLPKRAGLNRCGKSCRLRWTNYLRPDIKRGSFTEEEERLIIHYHSLLGNKWSAIAARLSGRTDNEIKNYWNTHIRKKLLTMGIDPVTHMPKTNLNLLASLPNLIAAAANLNNLAANNPLISALQLPKLQLLQTLVHAMANNTSPPNMNCTNLFSYLNPNPMSSNLNNLQALLGSNSNFLNESVNYTNGGNSSTTTTTSTSFLSTPNANSTPSLVSSSPENQTVDQAQEMVNLSEVSSSSTTPSSKPFEAWRELTLDDIDSDLGWKDILDQISWTNNPL